MKRCDDETLKSSIILKAEKEEYGTRVFHGDEIQLRCSFCGGLIAEKPYLEVIDGKTHYFTSYKCAKAFKERK
ncbi:MAG: hypothetical protein ACE5K0_09765 [Candidatus Methanofastidiosia archaeon]